MTETTPAAAPAAPAAAPAASAPAAPVAAAPAAPAAAPAPAPAPEPVDSLIPADPAAPAPAPQTEAEKIAAARELVKQADAAADPNSGKAWLLHEGVMGQGEKPAWFKQEKYKTVSAQAEAYVALESRFGAFKGAPKNEKGETVYSFKPPEGIEFKSDHPMAQAFTKWAGENQLSQDGYNELLDQLVQYEVAQQPNMADIKTSLGNDADNRISNAAAWVKANLGAEGFANFRQATSDKNAAAVFKMVEALIGKSGQAKIPSPNREPGSVPATGGEGLAAIQAAHGERVKEGPNAGKLRTDVDPAYAAAIHKRYNDYYAGQAA